MFYNLSSAYSSILSRLEKQLRSVKKDLAEALLQTAKMENKQNEREKEIFDAFKELIKIKPSTEYIDWNKGCEENSEKLREYFCQENTILNDIPFKECDKIPPWTIELYLPGLPSVSFLRYKKNKCGSVRRSIKITTDSQTYSEYFLSGTDMFKIFKLMVESADQEEVKRWFVNNFVNKKENN